MIAQLRGQMVEKSLEKDALRVVVDVHGVGYEVLMPKASEAHVPDGGPATLYVSEAVTAYDGATTLYGFLSRQEKDFFTRIRDNVGGMGPKKALECLDKISKSLPDFKRAILDQDVRLLVSVFGFTKKTAEKLVFSLKGKADEWSVPGSTKWAGVGASSQESEALSGLLNLGYRPDEANEIIRQVKSKLGGKADTPAILQEALRLMGSRRTT